MSEIRQLPLLCLFSLVALAVPAQAQELIDQYVPPAGAGGGDAFQPGVTVLSRDRPEYESLGVRVGNFVIRPELAESVGYDSNPTGSAHASGSALIETNASVNAVSEWSLSRFNAGVSVDDFRYPSLPAQAYTNWSAGAGASHEFGHDIGTVNFSHQALNVLPIGLDVPQLQTPLPYSVDDGQLSYRVNLARAFFTPTLDVQSYDFGKSTIGGVAYDQGFRNRVVVVPSLTGGYELSPRRNIVAVFRDSDAVYAHAEPHLPKRDYNDAAFLGGFDYDADGVIRYRVLIGYELRNFRSAQYKTISAPIAEASVVWTPTGLTTVTGTAARRIEDSADETTAGYTVNSVLLRVDHEYLPNVLLHANTGVSFTSYRGGGSQTFYTVGAGGSYLLNRNVRLALNYNFSVRDSGSTSGFGTTGTFLGASYTDHQIVLQLRLRL